jgi:voltage-gated potassium channel
MAEVSTDRADPEARRHRWEELTTWPLMLVAVVFLAAFALPIVHDSLDDDLQRLCSTVVVVTWWTFVVDYVVRLVLARDRLGFVRRHVLDLAAVALPALRPLLLLRVVAVLERTLEHNLGGRLMVYVTSLTGLAVLVGSIAVLNAEEDRAGSNIHSLSTALWWAITTVTTVGYGDHYPVTGQGRMVAAVLMLCGIGLIGVVTASLASYIVDRVSEEDESVEQRTHRAVEDLVGEVQALRREVDELRRASRSTPRPGSDPDVDSG